MISTKFVQCNHLTLHLGSEWGQTFEWGGHSFPGPSWNRRWHLASLYLTLRCTSYTQDIRERLVSFISHANLYERSASMPLWCYFTDARNENRHRMWLPSRNGSHFLWIRVHQTACDV